MDNWKIVVVDRGTPLTPQKSPAHLGDVVVDAAEGDHLERALAHDERLLGAVARGVGGVDPEQEVQVHRRRELGRARETAHLGVVPTKFSDFLTPSRLSAFGTDLYYRILATSFTTFAFPWP